VGNRALVWEASVDGYGKIVAEYIESHSGSVGQALRLPEEGDFWMSLCQEVVAS